MPIRAISFDLDDTLLRSDRTVMRADIDAIAEARQKGIEIFPASGRRFNSMEPALRAIGHAGLAITLNGARVSRYPGDTPVYERYVAPGLCAEIAQLAKEQGLYVQTYVGDDFEYEADCEQSRLYARLSGGGGVAVGDLAGYMDSVGRPSKKMLFIDMDEEKILRMQDIMVERYGESLSIFRSKPIYLEVTHPEATKGRALAALCAERGIGPGEVLALGDGENDLSMLTWARYGVAIGNAERAIRERTGYVTSSNMECGVARAIREFAL